MLLFIYKTISFNCRSSHFLHARKCFLIYFPLWFFSPSMPAAQRVSEDTLQALNTTSDLMRPHPPPPRCQNKPRPPFGAPPSKTSAKVKLINSSSLSGTLGQPRSVLASPGLRKTQTPICNMIASSWHADSHVPTSPPGPVGEQIMVQTTHNCSPSPEQDSADLHCRNSSCNPSFQIKTPTIHGTHLSSSRSIHSPGRKFDFSPQTVRRGTATWRRRPINTITSSPHCDADSYSSSSSAEHSVSAAGKSKTQNSTCRGSLVSTAVQADNNRGKITPESLHSLGGSRRSNAGLEINKNSHLGKDVTQQQSLVATVWQIALTSSRKQGYDTKTFVLSTDKENSLSASKFAWIKYLFGTCVL